VFPGRLSVSRTFGDIEAKLTRLEGNPNVVIAEPDITAFKITEQSKYDFIVIGCDGIFDKLDNKETVHLRYTGKISSNAKKIFQLEKFWLEKMRVPMFSVDSQSIVYSKTCALRKACDKRAVVAIAFEFFPIVHKIPFSLFGKRRRFN
jgi:hypothetical protein